MNTFEEIWEIRMLIRCMSTIALQPKADTEDIRMQLLLKD
jgi:hypothetical protein